MLIWPVLLVVAAYWLGDDMKALIARVRSAKVPGLQVEMFEQKAEQIQTVLDDATQPAEQRVLEARKPAEELLALARSWQPDEKNSELYEKYLRRMGPGS